MISDALELRDVKSVLVSLIYGLRIVVLQRSGYVALPAYEASTVATSRAEDIHVLLQAYGTETLCNQELAGRRLQRSKCIAVAQRKQE
jgi:hypothetical protein